MRGHLSSLKRRQQAHRQLGHNALNLPRCQASHGLHPPLHRPTHLTEISPRANTRWWCSARSVASVCMAPRALVGKGSPTPAGCCLDAALLTGDCPALHSTRSASRICQGREAGYKAIESSMHSRVSGTQAGEV
jgi:hypothetical protein